MSDHVDLEAYLEKEFQFDPTFGFVEKNPLKELPTYFEPWMDLARRLEDHRRSGTLMAAVEAVPLLDDSSLRTQRELCLAHLLLAAIGMSYVHNDPNNPSQILPRQISLPWVSVSRRLGVPPIIIHTSASLFNWKKVDSDGDFCLDNLACIFNLDDTRDLDCFFLVPLIVEYRSAPAVKALVRAKLAVQKEESETVLECLKTVNESLRSMREAVRMLSPNCKPDLFYNKYRTLLSGWKDNPGLPNGLLYDGVDEKGLKYSGGSAAQSPSIQLIDAGLGVKHVGKEGDFLRNMRNYMLPNHKELICELEKGPSLRDFCREDQLSTEYNKCLDRLRDFRTEHLVLITRYIIMPSNNVNKQSVKHLDINGTGGTPLATFLKTVRSDVDSARISTEAN